MKLKSKKHLDDIKYAISLIEEFIAYLSFDDYQKDLKTKSAVERQLGIIGEAVNNFGKSENTKLSHTKEIKAFRNRLIHTYDALDDEIVWVIVKKHLPELKNEIAGMLEI